jgi:hypothetical protein
VRQEGEEEGEARPERPRLARADRVRVGGGMEIPLTPGLAGPARSAPSWRAALRPGRDAGRKFPGESDCDAGRRLTQDPSKGWGSSCDTRPMNPYTLSFPKICHPQTSSPQGSSSRTWLSPIGKNWPIRKNWPTSQDIAEGRGAWHHSDP